MSLVLIMKTYFLEGIDLQLMTQVLILSEKNFEMR